MTTGITLAVIGAGSSYTPELVEGLLSNPFEQLPVVALRFQDLNPERLGVMTGLAIRMIRQARREIVVTAHAALDPALEGADFVITQIRVGGMNARFLDESIPPRYGIIGQETTGPGGMFKALRTIPPMLEIANTVVRVAPRAFMLNYTNPSGIIAEAVLKHTSARLIGLCSGIPEMQAKVKQLLRDVYPDLKIYTVGLNHLGFMHRMLANGEDVTGDSLDRLVQMDCCAGENPSLAPVSLIRLFNAVPISYTQYYYDRGRRFREAAAREQTRAQQIMEIERDVFAQAAEPGTVAKPEALKKRGGGGYSNITFDFIKAIHFDTGAELVCTVQNRGAVAGIDAEAGVEVVCRVGRHGAQPLPVGPIPLAYRGLVQAVKAYESLTVQAAVERSRTLAIQALSNHPLAGDLAVIEPLVDEMLAAHHLAFTGACPDHGQGTGK